MGGARRPALSASPVPGGPRPRAALSRIETSPRDGGVGRGGDGRDDPELRDMIPVCPLDAQVLDSASGPMVVLSSIDMCVSEMEGPESRSESVKGGVRGARAVVRRRVAKSRVRGIGRSTGRMPLVETRAPPREPHDLQLGGMRFDCSIENAFADSGLLDFHPLLGLRRLTWGVSAAHDAWLLEKGRVGARHFGIDDDRAGVWLGDRWIAWGLEHSPSTVPMQTHYAGRRERSARARLTMMI